MLLRCDTHLTVGHLLFFCNADLPPVTAATAGKSADGGGVVSATTATVSAAVLCDVSRDDMNPGVCTDRLDRDGNCWLDDNHIVFNTYVYACAACRLVWGVV